MRRLKQLVALLLSVVLSVLLLHSCRDAITGPGRAPSVTAAVTGPPNEIGEWTAPFEWPVVAVHAHLLPNGKILSFGLTGGPYVWDPATGGFTSRPSGSHVYCAGHTFLPDGKLLITGGHITNARGLPDVNTFDYQTETWTRLSDMAQGRWYPTSTILGNGDVITIAGKDQNSRTVDVPEVLPAGGSQMRRLTTAKKSFPYYPKMLLAPNGKLFYAGHQAKTYYLDPTGTGKWTRLGQRVVPPQGNYGSAVMYEPGKVLYVGGGETPATNAAEVIDLNQASPAWRLTSSMAYARGRHNATLLADGTVLVTGGTSVGSITTNGAVRAAELWDPAAEQWRTLASSTAVRVYHSTSLLLPDARVLHAGSGDAPPLPRELSAEIFSPPYLFQPDGTPAVRSTISGAPDDVGYGQAFLVGTPDAAVIANVTLVRLGSVTHHFDQNQRFNRLGFTQVAGGLSVTAPASGNLAPPGHYMLFILNQSGVPSVARIIRLG